MSKENKMITREEVKMADSWAMEDLYATDELCIKDMKKIESKIREFGNFKNRLKDSSEVLLSMLEAYSSMNQLFECVYVYANQKLHENTGNSKYQKLAGEVQVLSTMLSSSVAFMIPELLEIPENILKQYFEENKKLCLYGQFIKNIWRRKKHILSADQEEVMAKVSELAQASGNIFSMFNNADVTFSPIIDENGEETLLTQGRYVTFLEKKDRRVRKDAFLSLYKTYGQFQNTLAAAFDANVRQEVFFARERKYASSLEAALDDSRIPASVYDRLIETVHQNMHLMYRYMDLRKQVLGLEEMHMYDVYAPMVEDVDMEISYEQAKEMVLEGLQPLGEDYTRLLQEGFQNRWIDVYENEGKRTGAYSWGAYGVHPYVLLNYQNNLNNVFTLAHEMGHALHSYYSDEKQPYLYAGYKIFVAEVASTCNEALLIHYLMEKTQDQREKAYLINYFLNQFKGTLYRQTMFAEFERNAHQAVESGGSLTAEVLNQWYYELNEKYYGKNMVIDQEIKFEWSRIPHFYTPFYVYQYATGFSAAIAISRKILNKEEGIVEKYKEFLSGGSSKECIDLLKICGVDMTKPEPVQSALEVFEEYLGLFEQIVQKP